MLHSLQHVRCAGSKFMTRSLTCARTFNACVHELADTVTRSVHPRREPAEPGPAGQRCKHLAVFQDCASSSDSVDKNATSFVGAPEADRELLAKRSQIV